MKDKKLPMVLGILAFLLALLITLYPIISNYVNEKYASEIHTAYEEIIQQADNSDLLEAKKQAIAYNAGGDYVVGTFNESYSLKLGVDPGLVAFLTDRFALQMNVGVFGVQYSWTNQIHNQVDNGNSDSTSAGFMVNLLSIGVGLSYYFL